MAISMISVKENIKNVEEFNYLYDAVGWGSYDNDVSKIALDNTLYSVSIYDDGKIIGYGRIIGDGVCFIYIHDIMVIPSYQLKGIGTIIMNNLLNKIKEIKKTNSFVRVYLELLQEKRNFIKSLDLLLEKKQV